MRLKLIERPSIHERGDYSLIIFPSRPYWFSATADIKSVLRVLEKEIEMTAAVSQLAVDLQISMVESLAILEEISELLFLNEVLLVDGKLQNKNIPIAPKKQLNYVEDVLNIAVTYGCNLACPHCYANAHKRLDNEMSTVEIMKIIDDLSEMPWYNRVSRINLTGGEFFSRRDALEIIRYSYSKGFKIIVTTNGLLVSEKIANELATFSDFQVSVSLDGSCAKYHEEIRGAGTFDPTVRSIERLVDLGISVGINMFVHRGNLEEIGPTLHLASQLGVAAFNSLGLMYVGRGKAENGLSKVPEYELNRVLFEIIRKNPTYRKLMMNSTFANQIMGIASGVKSHSCGLGTDRSVYIKPDGKLYPCPDTAIEPFLLGNVRHENLKEIWTNSPVLEKLRKLDIDSSNPRCSKCDVRYFCAGNCRGENFQRTGNLVSPHFNCKDIKKSILDMMSMLTEEPTLFGEKVDYLYAKIC